jgi:hypothetical protein
MGTNDPLIEQMVHKALALEERQAAWQLAEANHPDQIRQEVEKVVGWYLGGDKKNGHHEAKELFPKFNRLSRDVLHGDFFQFYEEFSAIRQGFDGRALGSDEGRKGGYRYVVSLPYNPSPVVNPNLPSGKYKNYQRVGFLYQNDRLIAYAHYHDLGDGNGPLSSEDKDTLTKGALFLKNQIVALMPSDTGPNAGVFGTTEQLRAFLEGHLYGELEELAGNDERPGTAHKETTPLNYEYLPVGKKIARGAGSLVLSVAKSSFRGTQRPHLR